jgi:hypothetical protein
MKEHIVCLLVVADTSYRGRNRRLRFPNLKSNFLDLMLATNIPINWMTRYYWIVSE